MARIKSQQGYTLIELLIAMVILVSLMFTANYSYSVYSQYWAGRLGSFDQTLFYYRGLLQVKETIDSSIPYILDGGQLGQTFYFLGRAEGFTLVTAAPIFAKTVNDAAIVRIFSEQIQGGQFQLVYEEAPLTDDLLLTLDQELKFKYRTVLMRTAGSIKFEYFGWDHYDHRYNPDLKQGPAARWRASYDAASTRIQPSKIRLHLAQAILEFDLPEGHLGLLDAYILGREGI